MTSVDDHPLAPMVRKLAQWQELDEDDQEAVLALPYSPRSLTAASHIVREGDEPTHSCLLCSGFAYRHKIVAGGGRQILALQPAAGRNGDVA